MGIKVGRGALGNVPNSQDAAADAAALLKDLVDEVQLDFVEISGGDYEDIDFLRHNATRDGPYYARTAAALRAAGYAGVLVVTGGVHSLDDVLKARDAGADAVGLGRAFCAHPAEVRPALLGVPDCDDWEAYRARADAALAIPSPEIEHIVNAKRWLPSLDLFVSGVEVAHYTRALAGLEIPALPAGVYTAHLIALTAIRAAWPRPGRIEGWMFLLWRWFWTALRRLCSL